jgi:hypothetical protein
MTSIFPHRSYGRRGCVVALALVVLASIVSLKAMPASASPIDLGTTCATPVTSAPTEPATVSAASTPGYERTLVVGAGPNAGCALYLPTSDRPGVNPPSYACTGSGAGSCPTTIWPALLTSGAPIAGTGVNPTQLGTVTRTDILANTSVQQVTYGGMPVYQFFLNKVSWGPSWRQSVRSVYGPGRGPSSAGRLVLALTRSRAGGSRRGYPV